MTRNGIAYQRPPLVPLTDVIGSGLWLTPDVPNGGRVAKEITSTGQTPKGKRTVGLEMQVRMVEAKMWPTPRSYSHAEGTNQPGLTTLDIRLWGLYRHDPKHARYWPTPISYNERGSRQSWVEAGKGGLDLVTAVKMWPTPTSRDYKDGSAQTCANVPTNGLLGRVVHASSRQQPASGENGSLNPVFVEWLMGYPLEWTVCEAWATRSSRKSRNGSRGASSPPMVDE